MGHPSEASTHKTAMQMNVMIMGTFKPCVACASGKTKKANVSKLPNERAAKLGERLLNDIASLTEVSLGRKKHWLQIVNDCSHDIWKYIL